MAEKVVLTTAETNAGWELFELIFNKRTPMVRMRFVNDLGEERDWTIIGEQAVTVLKNVNKRDFSGTNASMHRAAMEYAISQGVFDGAVEGDETL